MFTPAPRALARVLPRAALTLGAAALVLAGCAEPTPVVSGGGTVAPSGARPPAATRTSAGSAATTSRTAPAVKPAVWPTKAVDVARTLTDTGLGHTVQVKRILRGLPWPAGYTATSLAYELVAVEMTWTPSTTYTAPLRRSDFAIRTGAPFPSRPSALIDPAMRAHRLATLPAQVASDASATGWLVFKVDPKGSANLTLAYTRPRSQVSGGGQVFDAKVFGVVLAGAPVPTG